MLNGNNEIDWTNKLSGQLLGISMKVDRGQRIDDLIRSSELHKLLTTQSNHEVEIESPKNSAIKLSLRVIVINADLKLLIARDISERAQILDMRKSFISNASHELRTPLTVISGYLEMMQDSHLLPESLSKAVQSSYEQPERMGNIIEDLLTLSRLESTRLTHEASVEINMEKVINHICNGEDDLMITKISSKALVLGIETEIISPCSNLIFNAK